jgi:hypothetical protein
MSRLLAGADVSFAARRRQALTLAADGLFRILRRSEQALVPLGLACTGHVQGRTGADVAFAGAWLTEQATGQLLMPLRLTLGLTPAANHAADVEVSAWLMHPERPLHDSSSAQVLVYLVAPVHAEHLEAASAQQLCATALQLLETLPPDELAAAVSDMLVH